MILWNVLGFAYMALLYAVIAFGVAGCLKFPWWYTQNSDWDGVYITQTLALMNNGTVTSFFHPGATLISVLALGYHTLSLLFPSGHMFVHLDQLSGPAAAFDMLDDAMRAARIMVYLLHLLGFVIFWRLLVQLTRSNLLAYTLAAFLMTTKFMLMERAFALRPEIITLICLAGMLSIALDGWAKTSASLREIWLRSAGIGMLAGLACLAKIQALPQAGLLAAAWALYTPTPQAPAPSRAALLSVLTAVAASILLPWGWLQRPAAISDAFLNSLYPAGEERLLFGSAPAGWTGSVLPVVMALVAFAVLAWVLRQRFARLGMIALRLTAAALGLTLVLRFILLPLGMSPAAWDANSNNLLYSFMCSIMFGKAMNHASVDLQSLHAVLRMHEDTRLLGIPILWFVGAAGASALYRLCTAPRPDRRPYAVILIFIAVGILMDVCSTFRQYAPGVIMYTYAIYSLPCFLCSLGLWLTLENTRMQFPIPWLRVTRLACLVLILHLAWMGRDVLRRPWSDGTRKPGKTPEVEMSTTMSQAPSFWKIASHAHL